MKHSALPLTIEIEVRKSEPLYQEHLDPIYRYVYRHVRNREAADDLTSQIFLKAVRSLDLEQSVPSSTAWLFRVARTTTADYWRAHYRRAATHSLEALVEAGWEGPSDANPLLVTSRAAERVEDILYSLPERERDVLTCRFLLKLSIRDTALIMGLTDANAHAIQYLAFTHAP